MATHELDREAVWKEFHDLVNMTPSELEKWLDTEASKEVGWGKEEHGGESVGHHSGRRIVEIKHTKKADLTDDDYAHMQKVVGYIKRHLAQKPDHTKEELAHERWTYSLRNWGHDPLKES